MESKLKSLSEKEYNKFLDNAFKYAKGTFVSRTRKFDEFFTELLDKAKTDLHEMFVKTYGLLYQQNSYVFTSLFEDLRSYYKGTDLSLLTVLDRFFQTLFRKMFQLLNVSHKFTDNYLDCVTSQMDKLKPFGDVPQKLSSQVKRSFVAARTFVQGLAIGRDVILEVLKILPTDACTKGLMRMTYCPHCRGITQTKPCNNLCLNTMKGCLAYHAELNSPWNEYIEAMKQLAERLEGPFNIEAVVDPIDVKISEAIMILQENSGSVQEQVTLGCGQAQANIRTKRSVAGESSAEKSAPAGQGQAGQGQAGLPIRPQKDDPAGEKMPIEGIGSSFLEASKQLDKQLQSQLFSGGLKNDKTHRNPYDKFSLGKYDRSKESKDIKPTTAAGTSLDRLVKDIKEKVRVAKDFWIQLPYSICNDDEIAAQPQDDKDCWNGADRGRYTSAVQKDGVMNQINNPEVIVNINEANYIIEQQKLQLKIITSKLNNAFNGEEVTWVDTDIVGGVYGGGSGDYSGDDGIYDGSGSGDGSWRRIGRRL
ncbi:hypothetical protein FSP39_014061 [Pinctada imbricata]|uniref:Glypican-6 n=1 Tax=Pinctada imbricata TaxID=66713 RepID=A0AA88Y0H9_PINIB|nr:hypothetical protein FSP39_014061 [Pinctada imbricata]